MPFYWDAATGTYRDSTSGQVVTPSGQRFTYVGPAAQTNRNVNVSNQFLDHLAGYGQQLTGVMGQQGTLVQNLQDVAAGRAPSAAANQLQNSLGTIQNQALTTAGSGAGPNAFAARLAAIRAAQVAASQAAGQAAAVRAQESATARGQAGQILGQEAGQIGQQYQTDTSAGLGFSNTAAGNATTQEGRDAQDSAANKNLLGNVFNAAGGTAAVIATHPPAAATSDEREKKDISPVKGPDMEKFLDKLAGFSFDYKHPGTEGEAPGRRVGVMAQDAEKAGPVGKSMVIDGDRLSLDLPNAVGAALAAVSYLHGKMKARKAA